MDRFQAFLSRSSSPATLKPKQSHFLSFLVLFTGWGCQLPAPGVTQHLNGAQMLPENKALSKIPSQRLAGGERCSLFFTWDKTMQEALTRCDHGCSQNSRNPMRWENLTGKTLWSVYKKLGQVKNKPKHQCPAAWMSRRRQRCGYSLWHTAPRAADGGNSTSRMGVFINAL